AEKADVTPDIAFALKEAARILVQCVAPMMPHLAEECWAALRESGLVSAAAWPETDDALLKADEITLPVQVNGKKRGEVTVPAEASIQDVEAAVRALDTVQRAAEDKPVRKIIVVPGRIVNVVI
ncbi:MAG: class I tRNA ligase family protein, partial [Bosea sp. (in: a-proteobacteria)]